MYYKVANPHRPAPQILRVLKLYYKNAISHLPAPQILRALKLYYKVASSQLPAPQIALRTKVVLQSRQFSSSSSTDTPRTKVVLESRQCLHFAHSTRMISAQGCAGTGQIALSTAFRVLDKHDLRRGLRARRPNRTLACISRARHARAPQRVARAQTQSHSRLHFARSTRTISAQGCAGTGQIALSTAFRVQDTHDLRRGLRARRPNRTLACISRARHARSPQRVARTPDKSHSRLHFVHSTRTISAEGCARTGQIALSPAFRALDTHDLRRGLHFRLTLFVAPSAFKREFIRTSPVQVFHTHTCILIAYSSHLHTFALGYLPLDAHSSTYTGLRI